MAKLNINELLKEYGLTQKDLASCTGINKNTISKYCNDSFENINKTHIDLLCKFFDCTPNELFGIDSTVSVVDPLVLVYDTVIDNFAMVNMSLKEYKELPNQPKQKPDKYLIKEDQEPSSRYEIEHINFKDFKIDDEDSYNVNNNTKDYLKLILEKYMESEIDKKFEEKYKEYIQELAEKNIYNMLLEKYSNKFTLNDKSDVGDINYFDKSDNQEYALEIKSKVKNNIKKTSNK